MHINVFETRQIVCNLFGWTCATSEVHPAHCWIEVESVCRVISDAVRCESG
jgi:hypothetical protein